MRAKKRKTQRETAEDEPRQQAEAAPKVTAASSKDAKRMRITVVGHTLALVSVVWGTTPLIGDR